MEASLALHARLGGQQAADALEEIVVETHPRALALTAVEPPTVLAAKFSIPQAAAAVAVLGTGGAQAFDTAATANPAIGALRHRVRMLPFPGIAAPPNDRPARVTWRFRDGTARTETCLSASGGPDRPFGEDILMLKFAETAGTTFPAMQPVLAGILAGGDTALAQPWRQAVQTMTRRAGQ